VEGAALVVRNICYQNHVYDTLGVCAFAGFSVTLDELAAMLSDVTGGQYKGSDLERVARRGLTLERWFNHLAGFQTADDWLPNRFFDHFVTVDGNEIRCDVGAFIKMRREFYDSMGCDEDGLPTGPTLEETGLDSFFKCSGDELRRELDGHEGNGSLVARTER
jgi:aldehyde:ferredoxin oxidoreductase